MTETGAKRRGMFFQTRRLALKLNRLALSPFWYGTHGHHVRVLLVQDNPADVVLLRYGLEQAEAAYDLQVGKEGEEAASIFGEISAPYSSRPDLILLDLNLPKRSSHGVLAIAKRDAWLRFVPIVILSSSEASSEVLKAYSYGANSSPEGMQS